VIEMAQEDKRLADLIAAMEDIRVAMMTTIGDDGRLESRPMAVMRADADGSIWFLTHDGTHKLEHLQHVNLSFVDTADAEFLSVCGAGSVIRDRDLVHELWSPKAKPWFPDGPDDPALVALKVEAESIEYWEASSSRMVRILEMARASATGTRFRNDRHGRLDVQ
jgi:general stress protein 26